MRQRIDQLRQQAEPAPRSGAGADAPLHAVPDPPPARSGPLSASTGLHVLVLLALVAHSWLARPARPERSVNVVFEQPAPPPSATAQPMTQPPPAVPRANAPPPEERKIQPKPEPGPSMGKPVQPPPIPDEIPPPTPLPPPKRMGEPVPIPHLPVPGTVPPVDGRPGAPGPPAEEERWPGTPEGDNTLDLGAGGPGPGGPGASGPARGPGSSVVAGGTTGSIEVPKLGGGRSTNGGTSGGRRRGLDLNVPTHSGAFGDFAFDDKDYDWSDYWSQMYWAIWRTWMNRLYVGFPAFDRWSYQNRAHALKGAVLIRFVIERNGSVSSISVIEPSNMPPLDESAQSALKEVILPRLPEDFTKDREGVTGRFSMEIADLLSWKEEMKYMRYKGVF